MNSQKGFTLLELLVALAISGALILVALDVLFNIQLGTTRNVNQLTINADLNTTVIAIQGDLMATQTSNITDNITTFRWTDYTGNTTSHTVSYGFYGYNGTASTVLWRIYDGDPAIIGRNITDLSFTSDNSTISVNITASGVQTPPRSKTVEFSVLRRSEETE